jgi:hypothetical protein
MRIFMPASDHETMRALSDAQQQQFIEDGFIRVDRAFPRELAHAGRAILWRDTGCDPDDPTTWRKPIIRLGYYEQAPFRRAVNTPVLHAAFDRLVGKGRWRPRHSLGSFSVRFPGPDNPGDTGWHVDVHAAQLNRGTTPRFVVQPPLHPAEPFRLEREDGDYSPVEIAIRQALQKGRA